MGIVDAFEKEELKGRVREILRFEASVERGCGRVRDGDDDDEHELYQYQ